MSMSLTETKKKLQELTSQLAADPQKAASLGPQIAQLGRDIQSMTPADIDIPADQMSVCIEHGQVCKKHKQVCKRHPKKIDEPTDINT